MTNLEENIEDYKLIFENMVEGVAVHDVVYDENNNPTNYRITKVNKAYELYTGITAQSSVGKLATEIYGIKEAPYIKEYIDVVKTKKPYLFETFFPPMNKWFFITVISPKEKQFVTIFQDITARKKTEESLRLKNLVFDRSITPMVISDTDFKITETNDSFLKLGSYTKDEVIGKKINFFFVNEAEAIPVLASVALSGIWEGEVLVKKKDGTNFTVYGRANILKDSTGKTIGYEASVVDVSEKKELENKILESNKNLEDAQKVAGLGSYVLDIKTGTWTSSGILDQIFGIDKHFEHTIDGWVKLLHPEDRDALVSYLKNDVIGKGQEFNKEYRIIKDSDKSVVWVQGIGKITFDKDKNPIKMVGTIQDITVRKNIEEELKKAHEDLQYRFNELEKLNSLMIGRELSMVELKNKVAKLEQELAQKNKTL